MIQLEEHVEYLGSEVHVILVPSIRDANHNFVFPQVILLLPVQNPKIFLFNFMTVNKIAHHIT